MAESRGVAALCGLTPVSASLLSAVQHSDRCPEICKSQRKGPAWLAGLAPLQTGSASLCVFLSPPCGQSWWPEFKPGFRGSSRRAGISRVNPEVLEVHTSFPPVLKPTRMFGWWRYLGGLGSSAAARL